MAYVEIYSSMLCGFCYSAKRLLKSKHAEFTEFDVTFHPSRRSEMMSRAGGYTNVPQIFIDGQHVGGCQELYALDAEGKLDKMLEAAGHLQ